MEVKEAAVRLRWWRRRNNNDNETDFACWFTETFLIIQFNSSVILTVLKTDICDEVTLIDDVEVALMKSFKEVDMIVIGHPVLCAPQERRWDYCFVDFHFGVLYDIVVFQDMLVKSGLLTDLRNI